MINEIELIEVNDFKPPKDGWLSIPVKARLQGQEGAITLRLDIATAEMLLARLQPGITTARNWARRS